MQRLFYIIVIISLPLIAFFMFDNYRLHHPESVYAHPVSSAIDPNYHDPDVLLRYHQLCEESGSYGRYCWKEERVDVLRANNADGEAGQMTQRYQAIIAAARYLEGRLIQSQKWKEAGYANEQIQQLELGRSAKGDSLPSVPPLAVLGEENALVMAIQQRLKAKGYDLEVDGIFRSETETVLKTYQQDQNMNPSGKIDLPTFLQLWQ